MSASNLRCDTPPLFSDVPWVLSLSSSIIFVSDPVEKVTLASTDLKKSIEYWNKTLGLKLYENDSSHAIVGFADDQAKLELKAIGKVLSNLFIRYGFAVNMPRGPLY